VEVRYLINLARRRLWLVVLGGLLGALAGYGLSLALAPVYEAKATLLLNQAANPAGPQLNDLLAADRLGKTYADLILRRDILTLAIQELNLPLSPDELARNAEAAQVRDTQLIEVRVRAGSAPRAADLANRLCTVFVARLAETTRQAFAERRQRFEAEIAGNEQQYQAANDQLLALTALDAAARTPAQRAEITRLTGLVAEYHTTRANLLRGLDAVRQAEAGAAGSLVLIEPATAPAAPIFPSPVLNVLLGLLAGLGLGAALAWLLEQLDDRLRTPAAVYERLGTPVLGLVPPRRAGGPPVLVPAGSAAAEAYRFLRTNLDFSDVDQPPRVVLVTGAAPGAQAATTAANLAAAAAADGRRVLLVDADLRAPTLHQTFNLPVVRGLTSLLLDPAPVPAPAAARDVPNLWVLPAGPLPPSPADLLGSARLAALLGTLRAGYDLVLLTAAPVTAVSDALALAPRTDGVVLVIDTPTTRRGAAQAAQAALQQVGARLLGVVLDRAVPAAAMAYYQAPGAPGPARQPAGDAPGRTAVAVETDE
jgi:non-specific protein-tyrosine kinase